MSTYKYTDAVVIIAGVDLSDHVKSVSLVYEAANLDDTVMGKDTTSGKGGLFNWSVDITFLQNFAAGKVNATLFSIVGTAVTVVVQPTSAADGTDNPAYTGLGLLTSYTPMTGTVGDLAEASVSFASAGPLTQDVTP